MLSKTKNKNAHLIRILLTFGDLGDVLDALHGPAQLWTTVAS
jgi:hypothetical protein